MKCNAPGDMLESFNSFSKEPVLMKPLARSTSASFISSVYSDCLSQSSWPTSREIFARLHAACVVSEDFDLI